MAVAKPIIMPASQEVTRRNLLVAAPALGAALALPAGAEPTADSDTPMIAAYREWRAAYDRISEAEGEEAFQEACDRLSPIEQHMATLPFQNATDVLAFLAATTRWGDQDRSWRYGLPAEALGLVERVLGPELLRA